MNEKKRYPHRQAWFLATQLMTDLQPVCKKIVIAGSLRRQAEMVGDIEFLFIPKFAPRPMPGDLFDTPVETDIAEQFIDMWRGDGLIEHRLKSDGTQSWGPQIKLAVHTPTKIPVDFFTANDDNWWSLLVCRTGPAALNERICRAAIDCGLIWNPYKGFLDRKIGKLLFVPKSEKDVFARVRLPYLPPEKRLATP